MKKAGFVAMFFCTACMQSALTYVKAPSPKPLFSIEQILGESGLIQTEGNTNVARPATPDYPTTNLESRPPRSLALLTHTLEVPSGSQFTLKADTQSRLIGALFYAGPGFIYMEDESAPAQGKFVFQAGNTAGEIRVRLYNKDGTLSREEKWFIEVR